MEKNIKKVLKRLNKTVKDFWNIDPASGQFLNELIKNRKIETVLEIGTSNGYSGIWIAEALTHTNGHLYTVESNIKKRFHLATENFKKAKLSKHITQIAGHAPEAIPLSPKKFDLIFLDATKYEHIDYLKTILPKTQKGSIIITDNILSHKKALTSYIKKISSLKNFKTNQINIGTGFLLSTRIR